MSQAQQQERPKGNALVAADQFAKVLATDSMTRRVMALLPDHVRLKQIMAVCVEAVKKNPDLWFKCDQDSLYMAVMDAAKVGLVPDGVLGHAWLVPFRGKVQFIPGYRGLMRMAMYSGQVAKLEARAVFKGDDFRYRYGIAEELHHVPDPSGAHTKDMLTHAYAWVRHKTGETNFEVLTKQEIEDIRTAAPSGDSPAWKHHYAEMAKKTAIRRLSKHLPMEVQRLTALEDRYYADHKPTHFVESREFDAIRQEEVGEDGEQPSQPRAAAAPRKSSRLAAVAEQHGGNGHQQQRREPETIEGTATVVEDKPDPRSRAKDAKPPPAEPESFAAIALPRKDRKPDFEGWSQIFVEKLGRVPPRLFEAFVEENKATRSLLAEVDPDLAERISTAIDDAQRRVAEAG